VAADRFPPLGRVPLGVFRAYLELRTGVIHSVGRRDNLEKLELAVKFVDPGDPPTFQETMWKKGYKCQEDDWLSYVRD
jgi:hypothetical protein